MKKYSANWSATICAAIIFHFLMVVGFSYVLLHFTPKHKIENIIEVELVENDSLTSDIIADESDSEAITSSQEEKILSTFDAQDLVIPEINIPEPRVDTMIQPVAPTLPEIKVHESPKPQPPQIAKTEQNIKQQFNHETPSKDDAVQNNDRQLVTRPPITINAVYPEKGSGLGFKGYVSFAVRIGKDGKVKSTEILQSSGRYFVDEIARKAAEQWTFKPALDQIGKPMECDKIITFDFKKFI